MSLPKRNCILREQDHKYIWDPEGVAEPMRISVTGVVNYFKQIDYSKYPDAAPRGTHTHRAMERLAWDNMTLQDIKRRHAEGDELAGEIPVEDFLAFMDEDGHISPEGIDCSMWIETLQGGKIYTANDQPHPDGMDMGAFWADIDVIDTEYTMVSRRRSLGGQFDLMYRSSEGVTLLDVKTKSASWRGASKADVDSYKAQAGGYLFLLSNGDGKQKPIPWVDHCRTLVITPTKAQFLPPMQPDQCSLSFEDCWGTYSAEALALPF